MAEKYINCISGRPTPPHTNRIESGPGNNFSGHNKKTKRFMIFDPKKEGSLLTPLPTSLEASKKWVSSGGGLGGSGLESHYGMRVLDKIMILQGVKLTIQPLGVGYVNRPKKAKMAGYVAFSPLNACLTWI